MKHVTTILALALLMVLAGVVAIHADTFAISGAGTKIREHALGVADQVGPGQAIKVKIVNNLVGSSPGYSAFAIYLAGKDDDGNTVILDTRFRLGLACIGTGCVSTLENNTSPTDGIIADEITVVAIKGKGGANATVTHCTEPDPAIPQCVL